MKVPPILSVICTQKNRTGGQLSSVAGCFDQGAVIDCLLSQLNVKLAISGSDAVQLHNPGQFFSEEHGEHGV